MLSSSCYKNINISDLGNDQKVILAKNINTPYDTFCILSRDPCQSVRLAIASNTNVCSSILSTLINDPDDDVRSFLALNSNICSASLDALSNDNSDVRRCVAKNSILPKKYWKN